MEHYWTFKCTTYTVGTSRRLRDCLVFCTLLDRRGCGCRALAGGWVGFEPGKIPPPTHPLPLTSATAAKRKECTSLLAVGRARGRRRSSRTVRRTKAVPQKQTRSRSPSADRCGPRPSKFCRCRWSWRRSTDSASARCDRLAGSSAGTRAAQRLALLCVAKAPCPPPHCPSRQCSSKERLSSAIAPCPPPHCLSRQCSAKERLSALLDLLKYQWCTGRPWCRVSCRRNL